MIGVPEAVVVGVDPASTRAAFVAIHEDEFHLAAYPRLGPAGPIACAAGWDATHDFLDSLPWDANIPRHAFVEGPVLGRGGFRSTMVHAFTSGAIQGALHNRGCFTHSANVSSWKKSVTGRGNATKPEVGAAVQLRWPTLHARAGGDQDLYDAAAIAIYGCSVVGEQVA